MPAIRPSPAPRRLLAVGDTLHVAAMHPPFPGIERLCCPGDGFAFDPMRWQFP